MSKISDETDNFLSNYSHFFGGVALFNGTQCTGMLQDYDIKGSKNLEECMLFDRISTTTAETFGWVTH